MHLQEGKLDTLLSPTGTQARALCYHGRAWFSQLVAHRPTGLGHPCSQTPSLISQPHVATFPGARKFSLPASDLTSGRIPGQPS